jgi:hypothetical protein
LLDFVVRVVAIGIAIPGLVAANDMAVVIPIRSSLVAVTVVIDTDFSVVIIGFFSLVFLGTGFDFEII